MRGREPCRPIFWTWPPGFLLGYPSLLDGTGENFHTATLSLRPLAITLIEQKRGSDIHPQNSGLLEKNLPLLILYKEKTISETFQNNRKLSKFR